MNLVSDDSVLRMNQEEWDRLGHFCESKVNERFPNVLFARGIVGATYLAIGDRRDVMTVRNLAMNAIKAEAIGG